ncbi:hypothetical protein [Bifidobacterium leontopitheci]|uniref:Peptidase inhibitor family I36 n=1 Tax=Bifidobacterium leontopitheci TaxID=2650774 RepID=A0A6I1GK36_9BIFI|nr:hypothetical protein [Bifidobacterium leontopitheci]KAB7789779.1 hypothetical protein F7D09_1724 [Bifidobacterium leontopitheci]
MNVKRIKTLTTTLLAVVCISSFTVPSAMATAPPGVSPASVTIAPTRGCTDDNAGCWYGHTAQGDMQFSAGDIYSGTWAARGWYTSGNRWGRVGYVFNGRSYERGPVGAYDVIKPPEGTVTGKMVERR